MNLVRYALTGLFMALLFCGCGPKDPQTTAAPIKSAETRVEDERRVEVSEVVPASISYNLSAVGSLRTPEQVTISAKKAGIIIAMLVKEGDRVRKGQVLVQQDEVDARLEVDRAEAKVKEAEASLDTSRRTLSRYQKLLESKVISQQAYDDLGLKVRVDEARLALARSELNMARQSLADRRIVSPIDGVVNIKLASIGEHINVAPKDEILKIVQMDPLELEFNVPENWVGKIKVGDRVQFKVEAFSGESFSGRVQFISPTGDPSTRNVKMKAMVENPGYRLKPGFFAEVSVETGKNPNALAVPESSLFGQEGKFFVFIVQDGIAHRREVETGIRFDGKVEILKGIEKGERIVTMGHEQLSEGGKVTISTKSQTSSTK